MIREINFPQVGRRIAETRKEQRLKQSDLAKKGKFDLSTLSQLENGQKVSEKYIERVSKALNVPLDYLLNGLQFKVGFGFSHYFSPLFLLLDEDQIPDGFEISYFLKNDNLVPLTKGNSVEAANLGIEYATAPILLDKLIKGEIDLAFVPTLTYGFLDNKVAKLCSIMNTAKGGLLILTCGGNFNSKENFEITRILKRDSTKVNVSFLKDTVAENYFDNIFLNEEYKEKFIPNPIDSKKALPDLVNSISKNILENEDIKHLYSLFIGWEPMITSVKTALNSSGVNVQILDQSDFVQPDEPFFHVSVDCIVRIEKLQEYKNNMAVNEFLNSVKDSIQKLNDLKGKRAPHYKVRQIAKRLGIIDDKAINDFYKILHKVNFQFSTENI